VDDSSITELDTKVRRIRSRLLRHRSRSPFRPTRSPGSGVP